MQILNLTAFDKSKVKKKVMKRTFGCLLQDSYRQKENKLNEHFTDSVVLNVYLIHENSRHLQANQ